MLTKEQFEEPIYNKAIGMRNKHPELRYGQSIFIATDEIYRKDNIARIVQFQRNVDCFDKDEEVHKFLDTAYDVYRELNE